jgi:hypothetical protein
MVIKKVASPATAGLSDSIKVVFKVNISYLLAIAFNI